MKYNKSLVVAVSLTTALALAACGANDTEENNNTSDSGSSDEPRVMTDAMGNEVEIPANPDKILGTYLEDYLVTLGETPVAQWTGQTGPQKYLEEKLDGVPPISFELPPEEVASVDPNLILISGVSQVESGLYDQYSQIAPTFVLGDELVKDWRSTLTKIGEVLGKTDEAEQALADYDQLIDESKEEIQNSIGDEKVAALWFIADTYYVVSPTQSSGATLFEDLELTPANVIADLPEDTEAQWNPVTLEALAELDADHLFLINGGEGSSEELLSDPVWANVPAVAADQVYDIANDSSWLYTGIQAHTQTVEETKEILTK